MIDLSTWTFGDHTDTRAWVPGPLSHDACQAVLCGLSQRASHVAAWRPRVLAILGDPEYAPQLAYYLAVGYVPLQGNPDWEPIEFQSLMLVEYAPYVEMILSGIENEIASRFA